LVGGLPHGHPWIEHQPAHVVLKESETYCVKREPPKRWIGMRVFSRESNVGPASHLSAGQRCDPGNSSKARALFSSAVSRCALHALFTCCVLVRGAEVDVSKLPPPATVEVLFDRDIKPIFEASCLRCHGPEKPKSGFRLDNREDALKGGENGVAIVPGESAKSPLIHFAARIDPDLEMPPKGKGDPLTTEQIGLLRTWIDQGVKWSDSKPANTLMFSVSPTIRWISVSGNERKFREDWWRREGFSGGGEQLEIKQSLGKDAQLSIEGHALSDGDYRVSMRLAKTDLGFIRGGYSQYRKYFDDSGGYYTPFDTPGYQLDRDLYLNIGKAWVDLGLTLPDWPRMTLGYEHQFKRGAESTLEWGTVGPFDNPKAIYPASKNLDETVDIIKFDLSHEIKGVRIEDSFRGEFYRLQTDKESYVFFTGVPTVPPDVISSFHESYDHFQGANALRLEKQLKDWWLLSGGYLYSRLDGDAGFSAESFLPSDPSLPPALGDIGNQIVLKRESHILNGNTLFGPWEGLSLNAGVQNEWTRQKGVGDLLASGIFPASYISDLDKWTVEEDFGLRYTKIPFTVLFADTRFQQESIGHFEQNAIDDKRNDDHDFLRNTDASSDLKEYRAGFSISPWTKVSWHSSYKHRLKENDFDQLLDTDKTDPTRPTRALPGNGYPAFILARETESNEVESKLVLRWVSWLKTTLKYQHVSTDYRNATVSSTTFFPQVRQPGGELLAGNYDANVYSLNGTLTPWRRLYLSTALSYSDSRMVAGVNNGKALVPYRGDIYSILSSANYVANEMTDLHASYSFSRARYGQSNETDGLPLGIDYDRHGLVVGVRRQIKKNLTTNLEYGYFRYREPTAGRQNDYTAHAIFATLTMAFR
jgi:hypothetical protein